MSAAFWAGMLLFSGFYFSFKKPLLFSYIYTYTSACIHIQVYGNTWNCFCQPCSAHWELCWQAWESLLLFDSVAALSLPATLFQLPFKSAEQNSGLNFLTKPPHSIVPKKRKKDHCHYSEALQLATFKMHLKLKSISYSTFWLLSSLSSSSGLEKEGWHIPTDTPHLWPAAVVALSFTLL